MDQNFKNITHTHTHTHLYNFYHSSDTKEELEGDGRSGGWMVVLAHEYKAPCYWPSVLRPPCVAPPRPPLCDGGGCEDECSLSDSRENWIEAPCSRYPPLIDLESRGPPEDGDTQRQKDNTARCWRHLLQVKISWFWLFSPQDSSGASQSNRAAAETWFKTEKQPQKIKR